MPKWIRTETGARIWRFIKSSAEKIKDVMAMIVVLATGILLGWMVKRLKRKKND